jgi:hypothetical protein
MFGDSQCNMSNAGGVTEGDLFSTSSTNRFGYYIPRSFTYPRIYWLAYKSGNSLTAAGTASAGYLRYKSTTPGQGDLCEMRTPLFCFAGMGINDISVAVTTDETARNKIIALMATRLAEILDDLQDRGLPSLLIGLPPYSDANASEQEAQCVLQWNATLEGLAIGVRAAYYNPWHVMCTGGTSANTIPEMYGTYSDDAGLHYSAAGNALVSQRADEVLETGMVGGWVSNPARRYARRFGRLVP